MAVTLKEHLIAVPEDAGRLILVLSEQAKKISQGFFGNLHIAGSKNIYGEEQLELDKWSDKLILTELEKSSLVRNFASEEQGEIIEFSKAEGSWGITVDPLDGVSCVATNLAVGTIVGMFNEGNVLEKGTKTDAVIYFLYGPLTTMVYAYKGKGVNEFVLDEKRNEFLMRHENIHIPKGTIFGSGGLKSKWTGPHTKFIEELEKKDYKLRFSGSLVADFNQVLHYGGLFSYPATTDKPDGKLRLLFEANPLAFIAREAGGSSTNGQKPILEIVPKKISDTTPLYLGGKKEIELAERFLKK
ncbi:MAG: fructose-1,6-bisphosphatase [Candidatus Diapherotrites archaeon]|nr:fructose-1,6-bisphosphatase [Candidatus Diapherotrites archaeon]